MSNTSFESMGKCPPLSIIRGQMTSCTIFHRGQMSEGANVLHSCRTMATLHNRNTALLVLLAQLRPSIVKNPFRVWVELLNCQSLRM